VLRVGVVVRPWPLRRGPRGLYQTSDEMTTGSQVACAGARRYWTLGSWSGAGFVVTCAQPNSSSATVTASPVAFQDWERLPPGCPPLLSAHAFKAIRTSIFILYGSVHLAYNPFYSVCFFSVETIFFSHKKSANRFHQLAKIKLGLSHTFQLFYTLRAV
jgi:hypothetical protein